jgi:hypothetical protein
MAKAAVCYPERLADLLGTKLERMAQNPKGILLKDLVTLLWPKIEAAIAAGYSLDEIVALFQAEKVAITASTLKTYLRDAKAMVRAGQGMNRELEPVVAASNPGKNAAKKKTDLGVSPLVNTNADGFQAMRSDDDL